MRQASIVLLNYKSRRMVIMIVYMGKQCDIHQYHNDFPIEKRPQNNKLF